MNSFFFYQVFDFKLTKSEINELNNVGNCHRLFLSIRAVDGTRSSNLKIKQHGRQFIRNSNETVAWKHGK
ncbi:NADPH-dependent conjugated polyketone reductase [Dirofilaria immitis]